MAVKALIFDFGGVVTQTLFETHDLTETALGLAPGTLTWRGPFALEGDSAWQEMQADKISERDYWHLRTREVAALTGNQWTEMAQFVRAARGAEPASIIRLEFLSVIEDAEIAGIRLAILSNELDLFYGADFRPKLPFLERFEVIHDATYTNILKPDPRAYHGCLEALNLAAKDCLFIDDQQRNIDGAVAVGLQVVKFDVTQPGASYAKVRRMAELSAQEENAS